MVVTTTTTSTFFAAAAVFLLSGPFLLRISLLRVRRPLLMEKTNKKKCCHLGNFLWKKIFHHMLRDKKCGRRAVKKMFLGPRAASLEESVG